MVREDGIHCCRHNLTCDTGILPVLVAIENKNVEPHVFYYWIASMGKDAHVTIKVLKADGRMDAD